MIKAENLSISFGSRALFSSVSFTIGKGIFQFKGDSGKGKTTLRNILRKQQIPDSGKVSYSEDNPLFSYCGPKSTLLSEYSLEKNRKILKKPIDQNRFDEIRKGLGFHYLEKNSFSFQAEKDAKQNCFFAYRMMLITISLMNRLLL